MKPTTQPPQSPPASGPSPPTTVAPDDADLRAEIARCWPLAKTRWSSFLLLSHPAIMAAQPSIAQIHLGTRQVTVNGPLVREKNLLGCIEAMLAHEIGHHVKYPGSLAVQARLRILERAIIPFEEFSLINLFTDLLINESLGRENLRAQLIEIYQSFTAEPEFQAGKWQQDPTFGFYLLAYEAIWQLPPNTLLGDAGTAFEAEFPGCRAEAEVFVQNLFAIGPNIFTMFLYFVSVVCRYIRPVVGDVPVSGDPCRCGAAEPSPDDWADALVPGAKELEAIRRAIAEGWFDADQATRLEEATDLDGRIAGLPGMGTANAERVPEIMAAYYRQQAETLLVKPPPQRRIGDAIVPTTLDDWEAGDAVRDIDWPATLTARGELLGGAMPVKRERVADDEGYDVPLWQPRIEIYLDVSGSMPDPRRTRNSMTLAALILAMGAIRAGGWARACLYSSSPVTFWEWCRSERELSGFLMHYIGAGTTFPFDLLERSQAECGNDQPIRAVISDWDFCHNYRDNPDAPRIFTDAVSVAPPFVLLLHQPDPDFAKRFRAAGANVIVLHEFDDFPKMATQLALALFPDSPDGTRP